MKNIIQCKEKLIKIPTRTVEIFKRCWHRYCDKHDIKIVQPMTVKRCWYRIDSHINISMVGEETDLNNAEKQLKMIAIPLYW